MIGGAPPCQQRIPIQDASQIGEARRAAVRLAALADASETESGRLAIVTTELATNIVRHTRGGEILLQAIELPSGVAIEVLAIDRGPGMADVTRCMRDGYSTGGTAGNGLGAIRRQSDESDLYSDVGSGTVAMSRIAVGARRPSAGSFGFGIVCVPYPGEDVCGDTWRISGDGEKYSVMVVDGLGHGLGAAEASNAAAEIYESDAHSTPATLLRNAHSRMSGTRGAAAAVASIDCGLRVLRYAGVGNISGTLLSTDSSRGLLSQNGIVGLNVHKIQEVEYSWASDLILVMHSDGLQSRWRLDRYPGLSSRHPAVIAGILFRDFQRGRDDVTVVVAAGSAGRFGWTG